MSRILTFLTSFVITLFVCTNTNAATLQSHMLEPSDYTLAEIISEVKTPPSHLLVENHKILRYQLRHNYTLKCTSGKYGVIDFKPARGLIDSAVLLSGQEIKLNEICDVKRGEPVKAIYIYKRS